MRVNKKSEKAEQHAAQQTENSIEIRVQKADMNARTVYDYRRLEQEDPLFIPCTVKEEKETLELRFDTKDMIPFSQIRQESRTRKLETLLQAAELERLYMHFDFSLQPDNLYYDRLGRVRAARRDIAGSEGQQRKQDFLKMYQALTGYVLEGTRKYEDYLSGGTEILKSREEFVRLMAPDTLDEERSLLAELYESTRDKEARTTRRVGRRGYRILTAYSVISAILLIVLAAACAYSFVWYIPRQNRVTAANDAYLQRDYISVIDSLRDFDIEDMDRPQKYILATAYIQGQSVDTFSTADKETILSRITYQANETVLDYWISLGRLDVTRAEDLAMQMSDDQLLLYAYMQELDQVESSTELSGAEKSSRQAELMQEIETLADELGISYGTDAAGE